MTGSEMTDHWERFSRYHLQVGPPMRPSPLDLAYCWQLVSDWIRERGAPRVLMLGVTPELWRLPWPPGTDLVAVDRSRAMIDAMWPGPPETVVCADWLDMDMPQGSRDIVLCDGGLHLLTYPEGQHRFVERLSHVLSDDGLAVFRLFALPVPQESPAAVLEALLDGRVADLNSLKLRLSMALQRNPEEGVRLDEVYGALAGVADLRLLAARLGWPPEHLLAIDYYRGLENRFHLLSLEQSLRLFTDDPGGFRIERVLTPPEEPALRCPTVALRPVGVLRP